MSEKVIIGYKRLFEVRLLHHYWLDDGVTIIDSFQREKKLRVLRDYDISQFLNIMPTPDSENKIKGLKGVFKKTATGFVVAVPKMAVIPDDYFLCFVITVTNASFYNYTALTLVDRKIYELYYLPEKKLYRYKENIPVFSNLTGTSRGSGSDKLLFLSKEIPDTAIDDKAEFLNITGGGLVQLTSNQPDANLQQIGAVATDMPVFHNQNDIPAIVPPPGLTGAPAKGILLGEEIPDNVSGLIHITAKNPADPNFSCTSAHKAKVKAPLFQIRFKNRSAWWRYMDKRTGAVKSESPSPLPLTFFGNAGLGMKPGDPCIKVQFKKGIPSGRIEKIFTEIFE